MSFLYECTLLLIAGYAVAENIYLKTRADCPMTPVVHLDVTRPVWVQSVGQDSPPIDLEKTI
jgi:hypothetical protein